MTIPLDQQEHNRKGLVRAGRLFSNIVSPPVIFGVMGLALSLQALPLAQALPWAATYIFVVSVLPILFVLWLLKTGRISELHMSDTGERHWPYLIAVVCGFIIYGLVVIFDGPQLLKCLAVFNIITLAVLGVINVWWLISFHATAIAAAWTITGLVFGWPASLLVLPFVIGVVVVRLYLKRHTVTQVVAGLALGVIAVWSLTWVGCFI
jgi:membrane-associated phospholipid phosphatase